MSWSASSYPPPPPAPHRSRSRSPRSSRPTFTDAVYPMDSYRAEWDGFERERAWPAYERERPYDYGRRGRSRSPTYDDSRKRRRSTSPYERDRYDPRPRYGDDYDAHSRSHGYGSPPRRSRRAPPDPNTFDYPASLKQYAEWFRFHYPQQAAEEDAADKAAEQEAGDGSRPRNGIKSRWEKYKKDFSCVQLQTMFDHHRKSPWFAEKYDPKPECHSLRQRVRKEGWKGYLNLFLMDLDSGKFDLDLNESEPEPSSPLQETSANGESSNQANAPVDEHKPHDEEFTLDPEDDPVEADINRLETNGKAPGESGKRDKDGSRGEEISVMPEPNTVIIRTIPPDIGRVKLEAACGKVPGFMYLALGDPLQKRNYYRAGWIRFKADAEMSLVMSELELKKIEGFKLHVSHSTRPFINKIRFAPEVASRPERLEKDLANVKALAGVLEEEAATLRALKIPKQLEKSAEDNGGIEGDSNMEALDSTTSASFAEDEEEEELKESGSEAVERRVEKIMSDIVERGIVDVNDARAYEARKTVVSLDLYIVYLRAAFHTCYYCAIVTNHLEELQRKCIRHDRKPLTASMLQELADESSEAKEAGEDHTEADKKVIKDTKDTKRNDERWLEWLDSKIALLLDRDNVDPREYGGKLYDEELAKAVEQYIKQEDEGKYRCKTCQKLFKATAFVEKHVANKHPEHVKDLEDLPYFNNFALDPHRIQPFAHPPAPVGNTQAAPPQAFGISAPPSYHGDYGRNYGAPMGAYPSSYPPPYNPNGYYDSYAPSLYAPYGPQYSAPMSGRRDDSRRPLSDRISGYVGGDGSAAPVPGLPPKPSPAALDTALVAGNGARRNGVSRGTVGGPPPPPPPDAKEDPRAAAGRRVTYHDMDSVAEGDVELQY